MKKRSHSLGNIKHLFLVLLLCSCSVNVKSAQSAIGEAIMCTQDATKSTTYIWPIRVIDVNSGDNLTTGCAPSPIYYYDGTNWDRALGEQVFGLDVDVTRMPAVTLGGGTSTPSDVYANPTDALDTWSLGGAWTGAQWYRVRGDTTNGLDVDVTRVTGTVTVNDLGNFADKVTRITTSTDTLISGSSVDFHHAVINAAGTGTASATFYDDSTIPCGTGFMFLLNTGNQGATEHLDYTTTNGLCVTTAATNPADLSILYR